MKKANNNTDPLTQSVTSNNDGEIFEAVDERAALEVPLGTAAAASRKGSAHSAAFSIVDPLVEDSTEEASLPNTAVGLNQSGGVTDFSSTSIHSRYTR